MHTTNTKQTTEVRFDNIEDGEYRYSGIARCILQRGSMDRYTSYGWVQGEEPMAEVVSVVLESVEHEYRKTWLRLQPHAELGYSMIEDDVMTCLTDDSRWQAEAVEVLR